MRIPVISCLVALTALLVISCGETSPDSELARLTELVEEEKFDQALDIVRRLIDDRPTDSVLLFHGARAYFGSGIFDTAHVMAKQFAMLYPKRLDGYRLAYMTGEKVEDYDTQIFAVSQLGYLENNRKKYHVPIARLNFLRGEYGQAMKTCYMILDYDSTNPEALFILANSMSAAGKIDSAILVMETLNRQNPDQVQILSNLATFMVSAKDYEQARVHFERLTTLYPDYIPGWFGLGNVAVALGDTAAAIDAYTKVYSREPTFLNVDSILHDLDPLRY